MSAASAMGILVPPCLTMVVLGSLVNLSIVTLFLGGLPPRLPAGGVLLVLIARARAPPGLARRRAGLAARDLGRAAAARGRPARPSRPPLRRDLQRAHHRHRGGAVAVVYALVVGVGDGRHRPRPTSCRLFERSGVVTATTLWVLAAASAFAWILVREWVPQTLGEWIAGIGASRALFLALTLFVFVVIGALLEGLPALLIFGPILFPISRAVGVDPVHYGIVIVAAMGIAFFLPPVGVGLSIASGIARVDVDEVSRAYLPYLAVLLVGLALIAAWPGLTLALPRADPRLPDRR